MNKKEIIDFMNAHPECHVATVEGNAPHVRGLRMHKADENGILFQSWTIKDIYKQISKNPNVELCFNDYDKHIQVRVSGKFEIVNDLAVKKEIMSQRQGLKPFLDKLGYDKVAIFRLSKGQATVWTMERNFEPKSYVQL